MFSKINTLPLA